MTPKELKNSILQLAIQGKLAEQREEEGTAEELYKQIQAEKRKLIAEGKIKKEKTLPEITEDEIPFEIPESWKWVRLGECGSFLRGSGIKRNEVVGKGFPCIRYGQLYTTYRTRFTDTVSFIKKDLFAKCKKAQKDDILMALTGENSFDIALATKYEGNYEIAIGGDMTKYTPYFVDSMYLVYVLNSSYCIDLKSKLATGNIIVHISNDKLASLVIPIPPIAEQKRIVEKIETLLPFVDAYEKAWKKLEALNARFPEDLKKSILQLAIQGKLVEQREEEGTAEELYQQIQVEKRKLIAEGKIKKEKPLPEIKEDEVPFDIPESWKWVRLGEIGSWGAGSTPLRSNPEYYNGDIPWLKTGDLNDGYIDDVPEFVTELALQKTSLKLNPVGSVLMAMYGATIGKLGIITQPMTTNQACCACYPLDNVENRFLFYCLMANRKTFTKQGEGGAQPNISKDKIVHFVVGLPPLSEQKRIVEKIETLLPLCDKLK